MPGLSPTDDSAWGSSVLRAPAWVLFSYSCLLPQCKGPGIGRFHGKFKYLHTCDELTTSPGCDPAFATNPLGLAPAPLPNRGDRSYG